MLFGVNPLAAYALVGLGAAAYSPAKYGILTEYLPHHEAGDRQRLDRGPDRGLDHPRHGARRRADPRAASPHACSPFDLPLIDTGIDTPPRRRSRSSSSSMRSRRCSTSYIPRTGVALKPLPATRSTRCTTSSHCVAQPLERPARADLARGDDAVLGRRRHAAVHRHRVGARGARLRPVQGRHPAGRHGAGHRHRRGARLGARARSTAR